MMSKPVKKYPAPRVIAVDVDGTLHNAGVPNLKVIEWCKKRKADGFFLILWSARGEEHARKAAELFGVAELFNTIISKPGYILDDNGWNWIKFTHVVRNLSDT